MKADPCQIYIHIPFCIRKCNYCDFLSFPASSGQMDAYMEALDREIRETADYSGKDLRVDTVFFGGGTPSILPAGQVADLLDRVRHCWHISEDAEISLEANPGTLTPEKLSVYRDAGINRLSMGLQSPDDRLLKRLGRIHTWEEFLHNYDHARKAGFDNINIDLMSGLPGQSLEDYRKGLESVAALGPDHISSYSLILEEGTPFYSDPEIPGELPDEETDRAMYRMTGSLLEDCGYRRYEISNYALAGKECRHNTGYWRRTPYLGFGLGAASLYKMEGRECRFSNRRDLKGYLDRPFVPFDEREDFEVLTEASRMEEYIFLGLRLVRGIRMTDFDRTFSRTMEEVYGGPVGKYLSQGYLIKEGDVLRLSQKGIDVSDYIFRDFMLT